MSLDFNNADQQNAYELIPAGSIVRLVMNIRPGGSGDGGWLKASQSSDAEMLDCEFIVTDGPYTGRKIWQYMVIAGGKINDKGESIAANITRSTLRAILESARNIRPDDVTESGVAARRISGWQDFCGLIFLAKIGVEKDKTGQYPDKNRITMVITPDMKEYTTGTPESSGSVPVQGASFVPPAAPTPASPVPAWAR